MTFKKRLRFTTAIVAATLAMAGCGSQQYLVSDPSVLLTYQLSPTDENLENLAKAYNTAINRNRKEGIQQPGLYCDYAVALARLGRMNEANQWFNQEVATFPSSAAYVKMVKMRLSEEYAAEVASQEAANGARWQENDIVVDNPEDIELMRSNKPREAAELPSASNDDHSGPAMDEDSPSKNQPAKGKKSSKGKKGKKSSKKR